VIVEYSFLFPLVKNGKNPPGNASVIVEKKWHLFSPNMVSTNNMVFSDEDKILIKSLYLKRYTAKKLTEEFPEKKPDKACC